MGAECTGRRNSTNECLCSVATGPNAILVSPEWRRRFLPQVQEGGQRTEGDADVNPRMGDPERSAAEPSIEVSGQPGDGEEAGATLRVLNRGTTAIGSSRGGECNEMQEWWRETKGLGLNGDSPQMLCSMGRTAVLSLEITGQRCETLLDTGASRSCISPERVQRLRRKVSFLPKECSFTLVSGEGLHIDVNGFARSVLHDPGRLEELKYSYVAPRGAQARTLILVRWACDRVREAQGFWA